MVLKLLMNRSRSSTRAISVLRREEGTSTLRCLAPIALRMPVRKSATGSLTAISSSRYQRPGEGRLRLLPGPYAPARRAYQLALTTPGICPDSASSLKQMRHNPKSRK